MPFGHASLSSVRHARVAMIDAGVEAELLHGVVALLLAARDADRAQPFDLRDLPDDRADRTGRRGDDQRLAGLRLTDVERADVRREPGHAEHAERIRRPRDARIELVDAARRSRPRIPASRCTTETRSPSLNFGLRLAITRDTVPPIITSFELGRGRVGRAFAHAPAHVRIEREEDGLQQDLAVLERRDRRFFEAEIRGRRLALRALGQHDAAVLGRRARRRAVPGEQRRADGQRAGRDEISSSLHGIPQYRALWRLALVGRASDSSRQLKPTYCAVQPPSRVMHCPVMLRAVALSRNSTVPASSSSADELPLRHRLEHDLFDRPALASGRARVGQRVDLRVDQRRLHVARAHRVDRDVAVARFPARRSC